MVMEHDESSTSSSSLPQQKQSASSSSSLLHDVLGSATAGIISRLVTHPLDTVKARLQAPPLPSSASSGSYASYRGPIDALVSTYRNEGIRSLYGGFGAVIVGGTPGTVLYLTGYAFFRDTFSSLVSDWDGSNNSSSSSKPTLTQFQEFSVHFSSGMLAEAVTCIIYVPVDVVKERMQVQRRERNLTSNTNGRPNNKPQLYQYKGSWDALQQIIRTEGMKGIYRGYGATLASFGPFSALYFVFYERCKTISKQILQDKSANNSNVERLEDGDLPLHYLIACSAGAGAVSSWLTSPLDMAKLRLQVQRGQVAANTSYNTSNTQQYRGMFDCLHAAYRKGELFRGAGARVLHFAPATTVTMTAYEKCRSLFADALQ